MGDDAGHEMRKDEEQCAGKVDREIPNEWAGCKDSMSSGVSISNKKRVSGRERATNLMHQRDCDEGSATPRPRKRDIQYDQL